MRKKRTTRGAVSQNAFLDLAEKYVLPLVEPVLKEMAKKGPDPSQMMTWIAELKTCANASIARVEKPDALLQLLRLQDVDPALIAEEFESGLRAHCRETSLRLSKIRESRLLFRMIREIDKQRPYAALQAFQGFDIPEQFVNIARPFDQLKQISRSEGEAKARAAIVAFVQTTEATYKRYLITLLRLHALANQHSCPRLDKSPLGKLVGMAMDAFGPAHPLLIQEANKIRNAGAHETWHYVPKNRIQLRDLSGYDRVMATRALILLQRRMLRLSGLMLNDIVQLYLVRDVILRSGLLQLLFRYMPDLFSGDPAREKHAESKLEPVFAMINLISVAP